MIKQTVKEALNILLTMNKHAFQSPLYVSATCLKTNPMIQVERNREKYACSHLFEKSQYWVASEVGKNNGDFSYPLWETKVSLLLFQDCFQNSRFIFLG